MVFKVTGQVPSNDLMNKKGRLARATFLLILPDFIEASEQPVDPAVLVQADILGSRFFGQARPPSIRACLFRRVAFEPRLGAWDRDFRPRA